MTEHHDGTATTTGEASTGDEPEMTTGAPMLFSISADGLLCRYSDLVFFVQSVAKGLAENDPGAPAVGVLESMVAAMIDAGNAAFIDLTGSAEGAVVPKQ
jgi:hypothetical protein